MRLKYAYMIESYKIENHFKHFRNLKDYKSLCQVNFTAFDDFKCNKKDIPTYLLQEKDLINKYIDFDIKKGMVKTFYCEDENGDIDILGYELL